MCRNIKKLRLPERAPTGAELGDAALQFVRKISGYRAPSRRNQVPFDTAVDEVAAAARRMFEGFHRASERQVAAAGDGARRAS